MTGVKRTFQALMTLGQVWWLVSSHVLCHSFCAHQPFGDAMFLALPGETNLIQPSSFNLVHVTFHFLLPFNRGIALCL